MKNNKLLKTILSTGTIALLTLVSFAGCGHKKPPKITTAKVTQELNNLFQEGGAKASPTGSIKANKLFNLYDEEKGNFNTLLSGGGVPNFSVQNDNDVILINSKNIDDGGVDVQASVIINDNSKTISKPTAKTFEDSRKAKKPLDYANNFIIDIDYTIDSSGKIIKINDSRKIKDPLSTQYYGDMITTTRVEGNVGPILANKQFEYQDHTGASFDPASKADEDNSENLALFEDSRIEFAQKGHDDPLGAYYSLPNELYKLGHEASDKYETVVREPIKTICSSDLLLKFGYSKNLTFTTYQDSTSEKQGTVYGINAASMTFASLFLQDTQNKDSAPLISYKVPEPIFKNEYRFDSLAFKIKGLKFYGSSSSDPYLGYFANEIKALTTKS
ncbi:hypothetical protein [Mycoplasma sp. SG1]|uniref:hypothetical protein n=1 Tax=Mycoplasma sp. SG1 TaxID=2810348 RepID=UPI0020241B74|nr:hypothetical protein [Mycoplasma sp. SG1]URM53057.1 hypothetical protein JRW51_01785 [Mycoplasma sp. SG1]